MEKKDEIGLATVLKSVSLDNPTYYDYFTYHSNTLDSFKSEKDCLYNDEDTTTEIVINSLMEKYNAVANYAKDNGIDCDYITFNVNYGVVCNDKFAVKYKTVIEQVTEKYKSFIESIDVRELNTSKELLEAYKNVVYTFKNAEKILNGLLDEYIFSNLISFRLLSVDLRNSHSKIDSKTGFYYMGEPNLVVRQNSNELGDREGLFLVDFQEFMTKMKKLGFKIETSDSKPLNSYSDYLEGYKNGEYFKITGHVDMLLNPNDFDNGLFGGLFL